MCEWDDFHTREAFVRERLRDLDGEPIPPFWLLSEPGVSGREHRASSDIWMRKRLALAAVEKERLAFDFPAGETGKIRLGYLSNDFHDHATALLLVETLEAHDRSRFEVHAYSYGKDDGREMRRRLACAFDHFHDISSNSDNEAARRINDDGIHILIDLKGFTQNTRTSILALRPAPVQVNYLGYPGTLGAELCDYIISDSFVTPDSAAEDYAETFALLPHCYQPHGRKVLIDPAPDRASAGLPIEGFVFCCFNQAFKLTPGIFDIWCRLLDAVPASVLWLLGSSAAEGNLRNEALKRGIAASRLIFAPDLPQSRHLARLQLADLVLDTAPYGAHTTASDALWAGVPLITWPGETFASRVAGSLLSAIGLPELIVDCEDDYFERALALASNPNSLAGLRSKLAFNRLTTPLFDVEAYTAALEKLYLEMWSRRRAGSPLTTLRLPAARPEATRPAP
ncbi:UDP-N-acetylglucosamine-peptide N-acetylglucosaminyltransferase [Methylocystis heyeri]